MDKFSKKDYEICPNCGEMKPVPQGVTPKQIEEGDWQCQDCFNRSGKDYQEEKSIEHGQKEISKYDPEYEFLVKLVKLVVKEGIPPEEIRTIANAYPFETIDDVGDLAAKIWTLATEKYKIPSDWLRKRLGKTASLKLSKSDSGYVDNGKGYTCGRCAYFDAKNEKCSLVEGTIKAQGCCNFWNDKVVEKLEKPEYTKKEAVYIEYPNVDYRCDECVFFDAEKKTCTKVEGEITPTASCNLWEPITKKKADLYPGQEASQDMINHAPGYLAYQYGQDKESKKGLNIDDIVQILNQKDPKVVRINVGGRTLDLADGTTITFEEAVQRLMSQDKEGVFSGAEFSTTDVGVNPSIDPGPFSSPEDQGARKQKKPFPNTNWLPAEDEETDQQPWSNVASAHNRPFSKKANPDSRYWIAPDGKEFPVAGVHPAWIKANPQILKSYGINAKNPQDAYDQMLASGWVRISNEPAGSGFQIQVQDMNNIPSFVDDFIAKNYKRGEQILVGDGKTLGLYISNPFPTLQKAINKELGGGRKRASLTPQAFWIDPNGTWYTVRGKGLPEITHSGWARDNFEMLQKKYPELHLMKGDEQSDLYRLLITNGWIRIGDSWGASYQIQTMDPLHLPASVVDWVYTNASDAKVEIDDFKSNNAVSIQMPVENFENEVARAFQRNRMAPAASLKRADLSGKTVNDILSKVQQTGGVTYNLGQGDMSGTNNFAVSAYPSRSQVVDGGIDFDTLEGYMEANRDVLTDANNSLGVWSHEGKTYLDIVVTIPNYDEAIDLAQKHNQIAIWDLRNNNEIPAGGTGEVEKTSEEQILSQEDQNQIAAKTSPAYVIAVNNYAAALKMGHGKERSLEYAIESVANVDKIDTKKLVEIINTYL